jgi:hypothetical protein
LGRDEEMNGLEGGRGFGGKAGDDIGGEKKRSSFSNRAMQ